MWSCLALVVCSLLVPSLPHSAAAGERSTRYLLYSVKSGKQAENGIWRKTIRCVCVCVHTCHQVKGSICAVTCTCEQPLSFAFSRRRRDAGTSGCWFCHHGLDSTTGNPLAKCRTSPGPNTLTYPVSIGLYLPLNSTSTFNSMAT